MTASVTQPAQASGTFFSDVRFSLFAKVLYLITRMGLPPLVLSQVSLADYGLWTVCSIVLAYLGLTATGVTTVYVRNGALAHRQGDHAALSRLISTGIGCMGVLSVLVLAAIWLTLPSLLGALDVDPAQRATAEVLLLGATAVFLADLSLGAYAYLLHGIGRFRSEQKIWVAAYLIEVFAAAALLLSGWGIEALLTAFALRYAFSIGAAAWLVHRLVPGLRLSPRLFDRGVLRDFLGFGMLVQLSTLLATMLQSAERVLAGLFFGVNAAAMFDLGNKIPSAAISIPSAVSGATMPAAARSQDGAELATLYRSATRMGGLLTALPMPFLAIFALPLCQLWLGAKAEIALIAFVMSALALSCHLHILTGPGSAIFRGSGRAGNEFIYHGLRFAALGVTIGLASLLGELTVRSLAVAIAVAVSVAAVLYLLWNHRALTGRFAGLSSQVLWPALACYPAAALAYFAVDFAGLWPSISDGRGEALLPLALAGTVYAAAALPTLYFLVLNPAERERALAVLRLDRVRVRPTVRAH